MDKFFKTYFRWFQAALVVAIALLLAGATNGVIASFLVPFTLTVPEPGEVGDDEDDQERSQGARDLPIELFGRAEPPAEAENQCADVECSDGEICNPTSGICEPAPQAVEETAPEAADGRCVESDIALNLVGTMVSPDNPEYTIAVFRNPATNRTMFAATGSVLLTEATVTNVTRHRVDITRNGREECIRSGDRTARLAAQQATGGTGARPGPGRSPSQTGETAEDGTVAATPPPAANRSVEQRIMTDIVRGDDGGYTMPRDLIQEVAQNESLLRQQAPQVAPHYVNGQPSGLQLSGINSNSMFARIGIRNNDVLTSVNGQPITTPQQAAGMYDSMMNETNVTVTVLRNGRERTIRYNIQ
jgi:general secretion pathway protein C